MADTPEAHTVGVVPASATAVGRIRRFFRILAAFVLLVVGAVFVVTPLIPGWPMMAVGLSLLAPDYAWARRLLRRFQRGHKRAGVSAAPEAVPSPLSPIPGPARPDE